MKIGLVRRGYSATGGAEAYLLRFAEAAAAAGHACVLFASEDWPADAAGGLPILRVPGRAPRDFADQLELLKPRAHCDFLFSLERVWRCDAYRAGDGVHAVWLERRAVCEPFWKKWTRLFNRKHAALLALESSLFGGGAGLVIANSRMVELEIQARFDYPSTRIAVIHNGVPAMQPRPRDEIRRELGLAPTDYVLLFVGSGWERKGLRFAVDAMNLLKTGAAKLLVAGRGDPRSLPTSSRVHYLGPRNDVARLLAAADAFILPTLYEPFSNACLEALAAGLPVITTRSNGFAEIIEPGVEGEVVEDPSDGAALVRAIELWADPAKRESIRPRLLALGAKFSIQENVRKTLARILAAAESA